MLDFSDVRAYADSIMRYVKDGLIAAPSELYYPIRLKPRGPNRVASLVTGGVDHLELRCLDLNPFEEGRIDRRDVEFIHLLALWCAGRKTVHLTASAQVQAVRNYKNAARFDLESAEIVLPDGSHASVRESVLSLIDAMDGFYADFPDAVKRVLAFERRKIEEPDTRPAARVLAEFRGTFAGKGLAWAKGI